jgi:peptide methionine sulfoxide reductase MsrA
MCWAISDVPVIDTNELIRTVFDTHTPITLEFEGHDRGKTVYFALRWENTRGEKGPWSAIQSAIIP